MDANPPGDRDRFQYGYDRDSDRLFRKNLVNAVFSELYHADNAAVNSEYDKLAQLTAFKRGTLATDNRSISGATADKTWQLDALGNWKHVTGETADRSHNALNQVTTVNGTTLEYYANGTLKKDQTGKSYFFDALDRLVLVKQGDQVLVSYTYDALGRRITETQHNVTPGRHHRPLLFRRLAGPGRAR